MFLPTTHNSLSLTKLLVLNLLKCKAAMKLCDKKIDGKLKHLNDLLDKLNFLISDCERSNIPLDSFLDNIKKAICLSTRWEVTSVFKLNTLAEVSSIDEFNKQVFDKLVDFISNAYSTKFRFFESSNLSPQLELIRYYQDAYQRHSQGPENNQTAEEAFVLGHYQTAKNLIQNPSSLATVSENVDLQFKEYISNVCEGYRLLEEAKNANTAKQIKEIESKINGYWDQMHKESLNFFLNHFDKMVKELPAVKVRYLISILKGKFPPVGSIMSIKNTLRDMFDITSGLDEMLNINNEKNKVSVIETEAKEFLQDHHVKKELCAAVIKELNELLNKPETTVTSALGLSESDHRELVFFKQRFEEKLGLYKTNHIPRVR